VDETEHGLEHALATPVPDGLADRIILRSRTPNRARRVWALAASVVLVGLLGVVFWQQRRWQPGVSFATVAGLLSKY